MNGIATLAMVNLDCADPPALAAFYHEVLGWPLRHSDENYAMIGDGTMNIGFGRVDGHRPPRWPDEDSAKRYHLDEAGLAALRQVFDETPRAKGFGNGRFARNLFEAAVTRQASRLAAVAAPSDEELVTLVAADVRDPADSA